MRFWRFWRVLLVLGVLLGSSCSDGGPESSVEAVDTTEPAAPEDAAEPAAPVDLASAFQRTASATTYRLTLSSAQTLSSTALGVDTATTIDPTKPTIEGEVGAERSHLVVDLVALLGPIAAGGLDEVGFEMWMTPDRIVIDTTGYAAIQQQNPTVELGPFAPGISYVDLEAVELESPDLVSAIVGSGFPDPAVLAERLPAALDAVQAQDARTYTATAPYATLMEALGNDVDQVAQGAAAGVALNLNIDPAALGRFYADFYRSVAADVTIELDDAGAVHAVGVRADLSGLFVQMFDSAEELGMDISDAERAEAAAAFADTRWILETRTTFEPDADLVVPEPPATDDDRTQAWIDLYRSAAG